MNISKALDDGAFQMLLTVMACNGMEEVDRILSIPDRAPVFRINYITRAYISDQQVKNYWASEMAKNAPLLSFS